MSLHSIAAIIATELQVSTNQIQTAIQLLEEGNTIPFIARYRKEATGGLDDTQLRQFESRLTYLTELNDRKTVILKSIEEQGKLSPELQTQIENCFVKTELEDLYLPYKPKRRTKGQIAIEAGLLPLAELLWENAESDPELEAQKYIDGEKILNTKTALDGAKYILMERFAENAELLGVLRNYLQKNAYLVSKVNTGQEETGAKFRDYFDYQEQLSKIPSHRALALFRGRNENVLNLTLTDTPEEGMTSPIEEMMAKTLQVSFNGKPADKWRQQVISWTWKIKLALHLETELMNSLKEKAEEEAINVFAKNLKALLMAAPAGAKTTIGLDPGIRTGVKVAVVDSTGKVLDTCAIFPHTGQERQASQTLAHLIKTHQPAFIAIGNGTASRETERFAKEVAELMPNKPQIVVVSEAGASVYSASELAAKEFPDLDVSLRGAVSIAKRLQDPLAELVKIDPKAIGVGQYQHDVNQSNLAKKLDNVVEDCVNAVGVDLNTASAPLLSQVAGMTVTLAQNIVNFREENGRFESREALKKVPRLGPKAFEQCAGFMRIRNGKNPLDASGVHPEAYPVVEKILQETEKSILDIMGNVSILKNLSAEKFTDCKFGLPTIRDIFKELEKPGRDPRGEFKTAQFKEGVNEISDLHEGMLLEGTVTNVTNFGAFVDIGVHQDGLVHISALADKFVEDPHQVVKSGDIVKVKVLEVDLPRKRIALTMRLTDSAEKSSHGMKNGTARQERRSSPKASGNFSNHAFADALKHWKKE